jgi:hypothetical protein
MLPCVEETPLGASKRAQATVMVNPIDIFPPRLRFLLEIQRCKDFKFSTTSSATL